MFQDGPYVFTVPETALVNSILFDKIRVSDADGGRNAELQLSCVESIVSTKNYRFNIYIAKKNRVRLRYK